MDPSETLKLNLTEVDINEVEELRVCFSAN